MLKTIQKNNVSEIVIKKSKFIANIFYVETEQEATKIIKQTGKKYYDAKHNCFSYRIRKEDGVVERFSDDGEPSGTAGMPMLAVLRGLNLENVLIIVTRYFGGILLGTGGLVKAYTDSAKNVITKDNIINKEIGIQMKIEITYQELEKLTYYLRQNEIKIVETNYLENVEISFVVSKDKVETIEEIIKNSNIKILNKEITNKNVLF